MGKIIVKENNSASSSEDAGDLLEKKIEFTKNAEEIANSTTEIKKYVNVAASTGGKVSIKGTTKRVNKKAGRPANRPSSDRLINAGKKAKPLPSGKKTVVNVTEAPDSNSKSSSKPQNSQKSSTNSKERSSGRVIDSTLHANRNRVNANGLLSTSPENIAWGNPSARKPKPKSEDKPDSYTPRFSKFKSAAIAIVVTLLVAVAGFVVVYLTSRPKPTLCTVQFESNGGTQVNSEQVACGKPLDRPSDPEKSGFTFLGWTFEGSEFDFKNTPITNDIILIASWEIKADTKVFTVTFDSNGGSEVQPIEVAEGNRIETAPISPTRQGFAFDGWYLGDDRFDFYTTITEDLTLVAHWKEAPEEQPNNDEKPNNNNSSTSRVFCDALPKSAISPISIAVGETTNLFPSMAYFKTDNCRIVYRSGNASIASLNNSLLTGRKAGTTSISICVTELGGKEVKCVPVNVTVTDKTQTPPTPEEPEKPEEPTDVKDQSISLSQSKLTLKVDEFASLSVSFIPSNTTNKTIVWSSSASGVATVDANGKVTAIAAGTATITARSANGNTATCTVTVAKPVDPPVVDPGPDQPGPDQPVAPPEEPTN